MQFNPASAAQRIYVLSVTDKDLNIWVNSNQRLIGTLKRHSPRSIYLWDLYGLSDSIAFVTLVDGYRSLDPKDKLWKSIWVKGLTDDAGSDVYKPVKTSFAVSAFNQPNAKANYYQARFSFYPLISSCNDESRGTQPTEVYEGEKVIWDAARFPAMPLLIGSSFPEHKHYGPIFARSITFKASGLNNLTPVEVSVDLEGGKPIQSPHLPAADGDIIPESILLDVNDTSNSPTRIFRPYRAASFLDCMAASEIYTDIDDMRQATTPYNLLEQSNPQRRTIEMQLSIGQEISYEVPCPTKGRSDQHGPRFLAIKDRQVKGWFTFFSREQRIDVPTSDTLTMYFGSLFLFPMDHVEWQKPELDGQAGQGWTHKLQFVARAADTAVSTGFSVEAGSYPVSEFVFPTIVSEDQ